MPPSRNGIFYDLRETPIKCSRNGMVFHFSSMTHYNRYMSLVKDEEARFNATMSKRIGCNIDLTQAADVKLYIRTETRGFLVYVDEVEEYATCPQSLIFAGLRPRVVGFSPQPARSTPPSPTQSERTQASQSTCPTP